MPNDVIECCISFPCFIVLIWGLTSKHIECSTLWSKDATCHKLKCSSICQARWVVQRSDSWQHWGITNKKRRKHLPCWVGYTCLVGLDTYLVGLDAYLVGLDTYLVGLDTNHTNRSEQLPFVNCSWSGPKFCNQRDKRNHQLSGGKFGGIPTISPIIHIGYKHGDSRIDRSMVPSGQILKQRFPSSRKY